MGVDDGEAAQFGAASGSTIIGILLASTSTVVGTPAAFEEIEPPGWIAALIIIGSSWLSGGQCCGRSGLASPST